MSYSCNACGYYVQTGESHSCYTPSPAPANDKYKPIAERAREISKDMLKLPIHHLFKVILELIAELAEKLEPAEVRRK